jgi:GNAT superfamily N-acetyltransferase
VEVSLGVRRAVMEDAMQVAALWIRARRMAVPLIPAYVHTHEEVRKWMASHVIPQQETWVAELNHRLLGMVSLHEDWIDQLYVDPDRTGQGIGAGLMRLAKERRPRGLQLWTFESNLGARRFYERHGFVAMERTDGRHNEEGAPDIRYVWPALS